MISDAIHARRVELKKPQRQCASDAKCTLNNWQNWEYNYRTPSLPNIERIAAALDLSSGDLLNYLNQEPH